MRIRYSIKTMLAAFTVIAVSCAGILYATPAWAACFSTAALLIVLGGITAALLRHGSVRCYWIGFAVFATGYFVMAERDYRRLDVQGMRVLYEPSLITTHLLIKANVHLETLRAGQANAPRAIYAPTGPGMIRVGSQWVATGEPHENVVRVGHAVLTLIFAIVGGVWGQYLSNQHEQSSAQTNGECE